MTVSSNGIRAMVSAIQGLSDQDESRFRLLTLTGYARFLLGRLPG